MLDKDDVLKILANSGGYQQSYLQGALIGDINFKHHVFEMPAIFSGAHFLGQVDFEGAIFKQGADFSGAHFAKPALFWNCQFEKGGNFCLARFQKVAFCKSVFHGAARFWRAFFLDDADFSEIRVILDNAIPAEENQANWSWARFAGKATFSYAEFQHIVHFYRTLFKGDVLLEECQFGGPLFLKGKQNEVLLPRFGLVNPETIDRLVSIGVATKDSERCGPYGDQRLSEFVFMNTVRSEQELLEKLAGIENISVQEKERLATEWRDGAQPMFQQGRLLSFRNAQFKTLDRLDCQYIDFAKLNVDRDVCCSLEDREAFENQLKAKSFDVFISHASEDKEAIARPLANKLSEMGYAVFLDESEIEIGAELLQSLEAGISQSKYGVVILSPAFIQKKWTQYELDELLRLSQTGVKKLLPLWYGLNEAQVRDWSESIANYVALVVNKDNIADVAYKLSKEMS